MEQVSACSDLSVRRNATVVVRALKNSRTYNYRCFKVVHLAIYCAGGTASVCAWQIAEENEYVCTDTCLSGASRITTLFCSLMMPKITRDFKTKVSNDLLRPWRSRGNIYLLTSMLTANVWARTCFGKIPVAIGLFNLDINESRESH